MVTAKHWIAVSAISALGIGVVASGAIGVANAMPLVDSTVRAEVPPISTVPDEISGGIGDNDVTFPVPTSSPAPTSSPDPALSPAVEQAPAPAPQPVAPRPAATADVSVVSPASPASVGGDPDD